jgi:hypothetical protein
MAVKKVSNEKDEYLDRKDGLSKNKTVKRPLQRLHKNVVKPHQGKQKKFSVNKMYKEINKYFTRCEKYDELPSIKGMMLFLGMTSVSFYNYIKYPEFEAMLEQTKLIIAEWAEASVWDEKGMAAGKVAYMKNLHNWTEKQEIKSETTTVTMTVEEARSRLESLSPKLLEILRSKETVNQIANSEVVDAELVKE